MDAVQSRVRVQRVSCAPKTFPSPECGKKGRRKDVHTRREARGRLLCTALIRAKTQRHLPWRRARWRRRSSLPRYKRASRRREDGFVGIQRVEARATGLEPATTGSAGSTRDV